MFCFVQRIGLGVALLGGGHAVGAEPAWRLPLWGGALSGQVAPLGEGGPRLAWSLVPRSPTASLREIELSVRNEATELRISAQLDAATGDGTWRIEQARARIGPWFAVLAPRFGEAFAGAVAEGELVVTGGGTIRGGRPDGRVAVEWRAGAIRHAGDRWALDGIRLSGGFVATPDFAIRSDGLVELTVRTITTSRFGLSNAFVAAALGVDGRVSVEQLQVEAAGGHVVFEPFSAELAQPVLAVKLKFQRVGLQDLVALVPESLSDASGRVDGELAVRWSEADGLKFGRGWIALNDSEQTTLRLTKAPGLLTSRMPERIVWLPSWLGALGKRLAPANPAYAPLQAVELGRIPLRVDSLQVRLTSDGGSTGRSAEVRIVGRPVSGGLVEKVTINVSVDGPLEQLLKLGMDDRVKLGLP